MWWIINHEIDFLKRKKKNHEWAEIWRNYKQICLGGGGDLALSSSGPLRWLHSTGFSSVHYCCSVRHCLSTRKNNLFSQNPRSGEQKAFTETSNPLAHCIYCYKGIYFVKWEELFLQPSRKSRKCKWKLNVFFKSLKRFRNNESIQ